MIFFEPKIICKGDFQTYLIALSDNYCGTERFSYLFSLNSDPNKKFFKKPLFGIYDSGSNKELLEFSL